MVLYLDKEQENWYTTDQGVVDLIDLNKGSFTKVQAILDANERAKGVLAEIAALASQKVDATKGKKDVKIAARDKLAKSVLKVAGSLISLSISEGNPVMREKATVRRRALQRMRPKDLMLKAGSIYDLANARVADLGTRGTTPDTLAELKGDTDSFQKAASDQNLGMNAQTSATKSIPDLFREVDEIIYEEINGLMEHIEEDNPGLYARFNEAKKIKDLGVRHRTPDNQTPAPIPAA